jgi:hypothetical protein
LDEPRLPSVFSSSSSSSSPPRSCPLFFLDDVAAAAAAVAAAVAAAATAFVRTRKGESDCGGECRVLDPPAPPATSNVCCVLGGAGWGVKEEEPDEGVEEEEEEEGAEGLIFKAFLVFSVKFAKSRRRKRSRRVNLPTRNTHTAKAAPIKVSKFNPAPLETPNAALTQIAVAVVKPFTCCIRRPPDLLESSKPF